MCLKPAHRLFGQHILSEPICHGGNLCVSIFAHHILIIPSTCSAAAMATGAYVSCMTPPASPSAANTVQCFRQNYNSLRRCQCFGEKPQIIRPPVMPTWHCRFRAGAGLLNCLVRIPRDFSCGRVLFLCFRVLALPESHAKYDMYPVFRKNTPRPRHCTGAVWRSRPRRTVLTARKWPPTSASWGYFCSRW